MAALARESAGARRGIVASLNLVQRVSAKCLSTIKRWGTHSDPAIVGKTLRVNRWPMTIVGTAARDFHGTFSIMRFDLSASVTMAPALGLMSEDAFTNRGNRGALNAICRVRDG